MASRQPAPVELEPSVPWLFVAVLVALLPVAVIAGLLGIPRWLAVGVPLALLPATLALHWWRGSVKVVPGSSGAVTRSD